MRVKQSDNTSQYSTSQHPHHTQGIRVVCPVCDVGERAKEGEKGRLTRTRYAITYYILTLPSLPAATALVLRQWAVHDVRVQVVTVADLLAETKIGCREERGAAQYQGSSLQRAHILCHGGRLQVLTRVVLGGRGPTVL